MNERDLQNMEAVRFTYQQPDVTITVFSTSDVIRTSDEDVGEKYPDGWLD